MHEHERHGKPGATQLDTDDPPPERSPDGGVRTRESIEWQHRVRGRLRIRHLLEGVYHEITPSLHLD